MLQLLQCPAKLVRARGGFVPATDALEFFDDLVRLLPFHQTTNRLQVAPATACKRNLLYHILLINRHINQLRASTLGFVKSVFHISIFLIFNIYFAKIVFFYKILNFLSYYTYLSSSLHSFFPFNMMSVPKAAVNKDSCPILSQNDIGLARHAFLPFLPETGTRYGECEVAMYDAKKFHFLFYHVCFFQKI